MYNELRVRTQYDGKDYMSVEEIYEVDKNGNDLVCQAATNACINISTCADQGKDLWSYLRREVDQRLKNCGIKYQHLVFDDE
jgi:hypothetical protein